MKENQIVLPPDEEGGIRFIPPQGCEVYKVESVGSEIFIHIKKKEKEKERKLPKSWEEFCRMNRETKVGESCIMTDSSIRTPGFFFERDVDEDKNLLPDRDTAEAVLALCQLIQLRNCYNGDWVPDWNNTNEMKWHLYFEKVDNTLLCWVSCLWFKTKELRDEFQHNFRPLIEKLKPLYGIKEGGEE